MPYKFVEGEVFGQDKFPIPKSVTSVCVRVPLDFHGGTIFGVEDFDEQGVDLCHGCEGIPQSVEFVGGTGGAGARLSSFDSMVVSVTYFWKARFSRA